MYFKENIINQDEHRQDLGLVSHLLDLLFLVEQMKGERVIRQSLDISTSWRAFTLATFEKKKKKEEESESTSTLNYHKLFTNIL